MIAKKFRFHGHRSVAKVRGHSLYSDFFSVYFSPNTKGHFRMAVVVSKKTAKTAVVRNRIRRRLYEAVRKSGQLENVSVDTVFVVRDVQLGLVEASYIEKTIEYICLKIINKL